MTRAVVALLIFAVVLLSPFIVSAASGDWGNAPTKPDLDPGIRAGAGTRCIRDVDYMRVNHMVLLKDERAQAVRHGERTDKDSIKKCFTCHEYEKFCEKCHDYNSVEPGCFGGSTGTGGCHATEQPGLSRPEDM
jgi:hypothetical protein